MKKQVQLSPEKYIIKKSRTLEIDQCFILGNYKLEGEVQIIITRKHKNGNITFCSYLVDLWCMGVKDSFFKFNLLENDFEEITDSFSQSGFDFKLVDYVTAHNIIFAAYEYALDLNIKAHKNFENITKFFLEEDDEKIPLIEIECGQNGKPFYTQGLSTYSEAMKTIKLLEKNLGKDGFDYMLSDDDDDEYDGGYEDFGIDDKELIEKLEEIGKKYKTLKSLSHQEKKTKYLSYSKADRTDIDLLPTHEIDILRHFLIEEYTNTKISNDIFEDWAPILEKKVEDAFVSPSLLGSENMALFDNIEEIFENCVDILLSFDIEEIYTEENEDEDIEKQMNNLRFIQEKFPDFPLTKYIVARIENQSANNWIDLENEFPNYPLFSIEKYIAERKFNTFISFDVFSKKNEISSFELYRFLFAFLQYCKFTNDLSYLNAFIKICNDVDLFDIEEGNLIILIRDKSIAMLEEKLLSDG